MAKRLFVFLILLTVGPSVIKSIQSDKLNDFIRLECNKRCELQVKTHWFYYTSLKVIDIQLYIFFCF